MNTVRRFGLGMLMLFLAGLANTACANTLTGKITSFGTYGNTNGNYYVMKIGGIEMNTSLPHSGELAREAFLKKLTVTVDFSYGTLIPNYGYVGNKLNIITLQSIDLP
jgi:hypothetical protein